MRVRFDAPIDPETGERPEVSWPDSWPPPRVGDLVECPAMRGRPHWVKRVIWQPEGRPRASVYVVLTTTHPGR